MFFDKAASLGENMAAGTTGPSLILGPDINGNPLRSMGPGKPIEVVFIGHGLTTSGTPMIVIEEQDPAAPGWSELMTVTVGPQAANTGGIAFALPTNVSAEIRLKPVEFDAGTWESWIVLI